MYAEFGIIGLRTKTLKKQLTQIKYSKYFFKSIFSQATLCRSVRRKKLRSRRVPTPDIEIRSASVA